MSRTVKLCPFTNRSINLDIKDILFANPSNLCEQYENRVINYAP
jgi:hypothetical protein